ncbi:MAG: hypothetical protein IJ449_02915 [Clostridia bacterium]|nr:hypothetical protein [Clostridia bacterium]
MNHDHLSQINLLQDQIDAELAKAEPDTAYIDRCVDQILALQNNDIPLSADAVNQKLKQFHAAHRPHKHRSFRKWAAIAACFLVVISIVAVTAYSSNAAFADIYYQLFHLPVGTTVSVGNETHTLVNSVIYNSMDEMYENENVEILYPENLPENTYLEKIYAMTSDNQKQLLFTYNTNFDIGIYLYHKEPLFEPSVCERYEYNNMDFYIYKASDNQYMLYFYHEDYTYEISIPDYNTVSFIIENLR